MANKAVIEVTNLSVLFPLYHGSSRSLKKMVVAAASGRLAKDQQQRVVVRALSNINLRLASGDRLGLVGAHRARKNHAAACAGWNL
jgi:lipopolysaccharide transport system ATP-binding protein